jgi:hypothetical protein
MGARVSDGFSMFILLVGYAAYILRDTVCNVGHAGVECSTAVAGFTVKHVPHDVVWIRASLRVHHLHHALQSNFQRNRFNILVPGESNICNSATDISFNHRLVSVRDGTVV